MVNPAPATGLFDWSTINSKPPAIPGHVFHNTSVDNLGVILGKGYLKPSVGSISFTLDPCFTVAYPSVTLVFLEQVIREKYGGREPDYLIHYPSETVKEIWEREMEVEVKHQLVYLEDCIEILEGRDVCWKYWFGYKYAYKDVRDREYGIWRKFRR